MSIALATLAIIAIPILVAELLLSFDAVTATVQNAAVALALRVSPVPYLLASDSLARIRNELGTGAVLWAYCSFTVARYLEPRYRTAFTGTKDHLASHARYLGLVLIAVWLKRPEWLVEYRTSVGFVVVSALGVARECFRHLSHWNRKRSEIQDVILWLMWTVFAFTSTSETVFQTRFPTTALATVCLLVRSASRRLRRQRALSAARSTTRDDEEEPIQSFLQRRIGTMEVFEEWGVRKLPGAKRKSLKDLAKVLQLSADRLQSFETNYAVRYLPKKSGGSRKICIPSEPLKKLQKVIHKEILSPLRVHEAALAYRRGSSNVVHAAQHVASETIVHIDVCDFFGAITADRGLTYFRKIGWTREAALILARLTFFENQLPQGAPTSPALSNLLNSSLDFRMERMSARVGARYSRYSDDLVFSWPRGTQHRVADLLRRSRRILQSEGYAVNEKKTAVMRKRVRQRVGGLVVNEGLSVPRMTRRRIRAVEHRLSTGGIASMTAAAVAGHVAYQRYVEQAEIARKSQGELLPLPQVRGPFRSNSEHRSPLR